MYGTQSNMTRKRNGFGFCLEIGLIVAWVVDIDVISVWGVGVDLISV